MAKPRRYILGGPLRKIVIEQLTSRFGCICWYCGVKLDPNDLHVDHIRPASSGGTNNIFNMALACKTCNRAKWDMTLKEFFGWIDRIRRMREFPECVSMFGIDKFIDKD